MAGQGGWQAKGTAAGKGDGERRERVARVQACLVGHVPLADQRPDLLTGVNPATGQPAPYGADGVDINCAVLGFTAQAPTANLAPPAPHSQFEPR